MTRDVHLRKASASHYPFALELYLSAMRPLTEALMTWDERKQCDSFAAQWRVEEVQVVTVDGIDAGWFQVSETPTEIRLQQFFISPAYQRAGIGTEVLRGLIAAWRTAQKPIVLTVLKNNPARSLYERFAFAVTGEVGVKFEMRRAALSQAPDLRFRSDNDLGYLRSRTKFEPGQPLRLDDAYRLAHLPLVAPGHPDAIRSRDGAHYLDGRHPETFSLVMPLDGAALQAADAYRELEREVRASPFAAKIAWPIVARRCDRLHATICGSPGAAPYLDDAQLAALARVGSLQAEVRGLFSGNVNVGRLYLRVYPAPCGDDDAFRQIQRALGRTPTDLFLIGLYNLTDHLDAREAEALGALIERWWSRVLLRVEVRALWLLGATDDLVLESRIAQRVPLTR